MTNQSDTDTRALLQQLNDEKATALVPAVVFLAVLMVLGAVGNLMVVFFYGLKTKTTPATCFILALSIFDLHSCLISIPVEIADMLLFYTFESVAACRLLVFVNHFATVASAFTLCAIAVDRYRRICKPFERQLSVRQAKIITAICAAGGVFFGWPSVVFYTVEQVSVNNTHNVEITGYDCTTAKDESYTPYALAYSAVQFVGFVAVTIALIVFYFFVGRQLYKHKKFRFYVAQKALRRTASGTTIQSVTETTENALSHSTTIPSNIPEEKEPYIEDISDIDETDIRDPPDEPPESTDSIPDLRELVVGGLPIVDTDRPSSGRLVVMEIDDERPVRRSQSVLTSTTDNSGKSRRSIKSVKSVTICEPAENQIFNIESRERNRSFSFRPGSAKSGSTWTNSITRPNSASSMASFSTRPNSASSMASFSTRPESVTSLRSTSVMSEAPKNVKRPSSGGSRTSRSNVVRPESVSSTEPTGALRKTTSKDSKKMDTDTDSVKDIRMKMLDINTVKYTIIMLVIAVIFIVSCVPYLCLAVWRVNAPDDLVYTFNDLELVWFQIGIRSYFLNCAVNPLIYGFFNSQFREFFALCLCGCCKKSNGNPSRDCPRLSETVRNSSKVNSDTCTNSG